MDLLGLEEGKVRLTGLGNRRAGQEGWPCEWVRCGAGLVIGLGPEWSSQRLPVCLEDWISSGLPGYFSTTGAQGSQRTHKSYLGALPYTPFFLTGLNSWL